MNLRPSPPCRVLPAAVVFLALWGCSDAPDPVAPVDVARQNSFWNPDDGEEPFKVYTQNVYLGGDTGPLFSLDFSDIPAVLQATNVFWSEVKASLVPERAAAIVDRMEDRRPQLVGLSEVVGFAVIDVATGAIVDGVDLLAAIQGEIAARGLPYEVARAQATTASALPLAVGAAGITKALSFQDRVVVLRRTDVPVASVASGVYGATVPLGPVTLKRGWVRVTVDRSDGPVNFFSTQFEVQSLEPVQRAQLHELLAMADALDGTTIVSGDLNSDAEAGPGDGSWTPSYGTLLNAGFVDAWELDGHAAGFAGYTCCQDTDLRNATSILDERIDFVLLRGPGAPSSRRVPGSAHVDILGDDPDERTATSGIWAADHAGLVAGFHSPLTSAR